MFFTVLCFLPTSATAQKLVNNTMTNLPLDVKVDNTLYVVIKADSKISTEKIQIVKNVIMSKDSFTINGKKFYKGWEGALLNASSAEHYKTRFPLPVNLKITDPLANSNHVTITIVLTLAKNDQNYDGYTTYTTGNRMIENAQITIYKADSLSNDDLSAITRHEFGHALGLGHSSSVGDLMYPDIDPSTAFISEGNIEALVALYNGQVLSEYLEAKA